MYKLILNITNKGIESYAGKKKKKKNNISTEQTDSVKKDSAANYKKLLKGAKTTEGMFKIHQVKDKYYLKFLKADDTRFYDFIQSLEYKQQQRRSCRTNAPQSGSSNVLCR